MLREKLFEAERQRVEAERAAQRKGQVGTGDRSDRIRTYNFPQNRLSDHRINFTAYNLDKVMIGHLQEVQQALIDDAKVRVLEGRDGSFWFQGLCLEKCNRCAGSFALQTLETNNPPTVRFAAGLRLVAGVRLFALIGANYRVRVYVFNGFALKIPRRFLTQLCCWIFCYFAIKSLCFSVLRRSRSVSLW